MEKSPSSSSFVKELRAMSLAMAEVTRMAGHLKEMHDADLFSAVEHLQAKNRSLDEINKRLCREIDDLKGSTLQRPIELPNHVSFDTAGESKEKAGEAPPADQHPSLEHPEPPHSPPRDESLRGCAKVEGSGGMSPSAGDDQRPSSAEPEFNQVMLSPTSHAKVAGAHVGRLSGKMGINVRDCWLDAHVKMVQDCKERMHFMSSRKSAQSCLHRSGSLAKVDFRTETSAGKTQYCAIMHPVGGVRLLWNFICLVMILYDLFWIPLQVFDLDGLTFLEVFEWILAIFWSFDVFMSFRTGYFVGAYVEMRPKKIARNYAKSWLAVDIIIVFLEWMGRFLNVGGSASLLRTTRATRNLVSFIKLIRLAKMQSLWGSVQELQNSNLFQLAWTLVFLCMGMVAVVHVTSCIWYALGNGADDGWTTYEAYTGDNSTVFWYVASSRWVISQLNGRTDMNPMRNMQERLFTCMMGILLALIAQALFISVITKTMIDLSELVSAKTRRKTVVNSYLEAHPLTNMLTAQVKKCLYEYQDVNAWVEKEKIVLSVLPNYLQTDVLYQVRAPVVMKHSFFLGLRYESPWAMRLFCRRVLHLVPAAKCEVVFEKGDVCTRMIFTDRLTLSYGDPESRHADPSPAQELGFNSSTHALAKTKSLTRATSSSALLAGSAASEASSMRAFGWSFEEQSVKVRANDFVSEAALWTNGWRNQGRLVSHAHGVMLGAGVNEMVKSLVKHPDAFAMAAIYAEKFVECLKMQDKVSDIIDFEIMTVAPVLLNVTVISATGLRGGLDSGLENGHGNGFGTRVIDHPGSEILDTTANVYAICKVSSVASSKGEARFATKGVDDACNPMWYHSSQVHCSRHQALVFQVWSDVLLGEARLDPEEYLEYGFAGDRQLVGPNAQGVLTLKVELAELTEIEAMAS